MGKRVEENHEDADAMRADDQKAYAAFHRRRFNYCLFLMVNELSQVADPKTKAILEKYSCRNVANNGVGLLFPHTLKDSMLPDELQLKHEPKVRRPLW